MIEGFPTNQEVEEYNEKVKHRKLWNFIYCVRCLICLGVSKNKINEEVFCLECSGKIRTE